MTLRHTVHQSERISKLKEVLSRKGFIRAIEIHNGLSALIANDILIEKDFEKFEFDALWESSLTDSASKGLPDIELVSMDSRLATTEQIARVTDKPIIFDGDTGGDISQFRYLIPRLEGIGVSAIIIEDKIFPKRNSLASGAKQDLEDPRIFAEKIKAGKAIQKSKDFMIIARIESLIAGKDVEDALKRAEIYLKAGADGIMIHSNSSEGEMIKEFVHNYKRLSRAMGFGKPLVAVPTTYNRIYDSELRDLGFNIVIHANHQLRASYQAMEEVCKSILQNDRSFEANSLCVPVKKIFDKVGFSDIAEHDKLKDFMPNVIIPAAGNDDLPIKLGQGDIPKALVKINNTSMLEWQAKMLRDLGLNDITVITGHKAEMFDVHGINYVTSQNWKDTFVADGLMKTKDKMKKGFIMVNPDMVIDDELMNRLLKEEGEIVVVIDDSFAYHKHEVDKVLDLVVAKGSGSNGLRSISSREGREIKKIGKKIPIDEATHEALSLVKFSEEGARNFIKVYEDCLQHHKGQFHDVESVQKADFTDVLQEMIYRGFKVNFIETHKGWLELHNEKDYGLIKDYFKNN